MTAQSIVCGTCAASVPYGRLSCPNCGELLASVAGARRGGARSAASKGGAASKGAASKRVAAAPEVLYDVAAAPSTALVESPLAADDGVREPTTDWPAGGNLDDAPLELGHYGNGVEDDEDLEGLIRDDDEAVDVEPTTTAGHAWAVAGASLTGPTTPAYMPRPRYARTRDEAVAEAAAPAARAPELPVDPPGAYVPPLPVATLPAGPVGPSGPV